MVAITPLRSPESGSLQTDKAAALAALESMLAIRSFEEAVDGLFARGLMHGTMHLSIGQEASATGVCAALKETDLRVVSVAGFVVPAEPGSPMCSFT